jgi:hypothetical protein
LRAARVTPDRDPDEPTDATSPNRFGQWNNLERILLAVDDLGCEDLLHV